MGRLYSRDLRPVVRDDGAITAIQLSYEQDSIDPARVFRVMSKLVDASCALDVRILRTFGASVTSTALLHTIEPGSLRAWLIAELRSVDDDAIRELNWKSIVGAYLVRAKHKVLSLLEGSSGSIRTAGLEELRDDLAVEAVATDILWIPSYEPMSLPGLIEDTRAIADGLSLLQPQDDARFLLPDGEVVLRRTVASDEWAVFEHAAVTIARSAHRLVLLVKKPDYLGSSMWEFRTDAQTIEARVSDRAWLDRFQGGDVSLCPGDSIVASVTATLVRLPAGNQVRSRYEITEVHAIIPGECTPQLRLWD